MKLTNQPWDGWRGSVINWSIDSGILPLDDILQMALQKAADAGIPIAAAAGNSGKTRLAIPAPYVPLSIDLIFTNNYNR